ncbi:RNA-guided endonuclease InsQ/TnpB family protein [Niallia oryzisoli]|uniref:RNA-guided endonuclease InsQ/TnpB family protein n=1 Tax=Niallia oryzisoli TaxID=1737571 RepID=UPI0037365A8C
MKFSKKQRELFKDNGVKGKIKGATISIHSSGQTHISLKVEEVVPLHNEIDWTTIPSDKIIGCDLGLSHFLIDSNGNKIDNPKSLKSYLYKLAKLQRGLKNKKKGSSNYKKLQQKIAKLHLKIANTRKDFLHQQSRKLVNENQVIVLEDLNVKGMIKNKKLARSIADVTWATFVTYVTYKVAWENKKVVPVDHFFAS